MRVNVSKENVTTKREKRERKKKNKKNKSEGKLMKRVAAWQKVIIEGRRRDDFV